MLLLSLDSLAPYYFGLALGTDFTVMAFDELKSNRFNIS